MLSDELTIFLLLNLLIPLLMALASIIALVGRPVIHGERGMRIARRQQITSWRQTAALGQPPAERTQPRRFKRPTIAKRAKNSSKPNGGEGNQEVDVDFAAVDDDN
jgi:hypothetical protein